MKTKESGGFEDKPKKCPYCGFSFLVKFTPPSHNMSDVNYCPVCANDISPNNELSNDELLDMIKEAENS